MIQWCETQKDCNRLRLLDILVRPMQRLTKYSLLLKAILKKTDDQGQRNNLIVMDEKVDSFVSDVNSHLRQRQENERLKTIIARIESYEPVVSFILRLVGVSLARNLFSSLYRLKVLFERAAVFKEELFQNCKTVDTTLYLNSCGVKAVPFP